MNRKGFTLVELLVMMVVLGLLISVTIPNISGIVANQKVNATKDDAMKMVDSAKIYVASNNDIEKLKSGECMIFTLDYLDNSNQIVTGAYGGAYSRYDSFVIYKRESGRYNYYVRLVEKQDKGDIGVNLANIDDLTSDGTKYVSKITSSTSFSESSNIADYSNNSLIQTVCPGGSNKSVRRFNDTAQETTAATPTNFATDSWSVISNAVKKNPNAYPVGSTKDVDIEGIGTVKVRISNTSSCTTEYESKSGCGVVLEFVDIIMKKSIISNIDTDSNRGGWKNSSLREYLNGEFLNKLPADLSSAIIPTKVLSGTGANDNNGIPFETRDRIYLLSSREIWRGGSSWDNAESSKQLDYYINLNTSIANPSPGIKKYNGTPSWWWLRSANSTDSTYFNKVDSEGKIRTFISNAPWGDGGVSPAFKLA